MDILKIAESYGIQLKKVGKVYQSLCPFHDDTNPSFTIYPDTNSFYCFGCGVAGDATRFLYLLDPNIRNSLKIDLSFLTSKITKFEQKNYKKYLLFSAAEIFRNLFKKIDKEGVYYIMKWFDDYVLLKQYISLEEALEILDELKKFSEAYNENSKNN